jgi:hypothetical protein
MTTINSQKFERELKKGGKKALAAQRGIWESCVAAINRVTRPEHA